MRFSDCKYLLAYLGPVLAIWSIYHTGWWSISAFAYAFLLVPLAEIFLPVSGKEDIVSEQTKSRRQISHFFDWLLYLNLPLLYTMVAYFLWKVTHVDLSGYELTALSLGVGTFIGASGINVGHELGHRKGLVDRIMALFLLLPALYQHFFIEHNHGHHRYVATREDPATARFGESVYSFWLRSFLGGYRSAWKIECTQLSKRGLRIWSIHNLMLCFAGFQLIYLTIIGLIFSWKGLVFAVIVALIGILLLETINYIEHYGLLRYRNQDGSYEKVSKIHSWNSNHDLGRILLYELTRHADHHYKASKKYQLLEHIDESPQLPTGYPGSILMALVPPLWFKVMDKRVPSVMLSI